MERKRIYMDYSATTPVFPEVLEEMKKYFVECYGNPSSLHAFGQWTRAAVEEARDRVAKLLGVDSNTVYFTAGGSEADNLAIKGIAFNNLDKKGHFITSSIEHKAVLESTKYLEKIGFDVTYLPVDQYGIIDPDDLKKAIRKDTLGISIMWANNEVGSIQPIEDLANIANENDIPFHTDAVQTVGKIETPFLAYGVNQLSASAHKFYGPKGIGFLYIDKKTKRKMVPLIHGGSHEHKMRAGTENVAGIIGLAKALEMSMNEMSNEQKRLKELGDYLIDGMKLHLDGVHLNGHPDKKLPGFANLSFDKVEGEAMLLSLDMQGIGASSGSACSSKSLEASHVLKAMGTDIVQAHGSIRFTLGSQSTKDDIDYLFRVFVPIVERLRSMSML